MEETVGHDGLLAVVARIASDLAHLPAAPTPDWCERFAGVLTRHRSDTRAWVSVLAEADALWPRPTEVAGYSSGHALAADPSAVRLGAALARAACNGADLGGGVMSAEELLGLLGTRPWGTGPLVDHGHICVGLAALATPRRRLPRALLVCWDRPSSRGGEAPDLRRALASVLPLGRDRLRQALGEHPNPWLSVCEQRVLDMLTDGMSVPEIADTLGRSPHTIHDHVKRLHAKLGTRTRGGLLARVLGRQPQPPVRTPGRGRPAAPARQGVFVDHRGW